MDKNIASLLKAIAHPIRIKIVRIIFEHHTLSVSAIHTLLNIDQPIISLHLGLLRKQGIIIVEKKGKHSYYSISNRSIMQVIEIISNDFHSN